MRRWLDTAGRLLIVALFLIIGIRNLQKFHIDDHIARLTKFRAPLPKVTFWVGQTHGIRRLRHGAVQLARRHRRDAADRVHGRCLRCCCCASGRCDVPPMRIGMQNGMVANIARGRRAAAAAAERALNRSTRAATSAPQQRARTTGRTAMIKAMDRRRFLAGSGAAAVTSALAKPALAQQKPLKIGLMTVKTGGLAAGGVHLEEGITCFLKDKNFTLAGRKIELIVADTAGVPATAKTKAVELVERDKVDLIMGPLAAFEWLAIEDYLGQHKMPTMGFGGAEDLTQRHRNTYQVRTSDSSAQCLYPLADYAAKEMKLKAAITAGDDFAFGYEQVGGFQRAFEDDGGKLVKKLWSPFNTPDYVPYLAQIDPSKADVIVMVYAGANPIKFVKQYRAQGLTLPLIGGSTVADDSIMRNFGDEAIGLINSIPYTLDLDTAANHRFIASMQKILRRQRADRLLRRCALCERPDSGSGAQGHRRRYRTRQADRGHQGGVAHRHTARSGEIRRLRQSHFHGVHPQGREAGRQARQCHGESLSGREPVLALRSKEIPRPAGVFA